MDNDFVDRNNMPVSINGPFLTKFYNWSEKWKVIN